MELLEKNLRTFSERIKLLITLEDISRDYYDNVKKSFPDEILKYDILLKIYEEENKHKMELEKLLMTKKGLKEEVELSQDFLRFLKQIIKQATKNLCFSSFFEAVERSLILEKDLLIIYHEIKPFFNDRDVVKVLDTIGLDEKKHTVELIALKTNLEK
jgi:rubrerythrin